MDMVCFQGAVYLIILCWLNIATVTYTPFCCLFGFTQLTSKIIYVLKSQHIKITGLLNSAMKKTTNSTRNLFLVFRHLATRKCFQKPRYTQQSEILKLKNFNT